MFGKDSYLLHYMTQSVAAGKIPKAIGGSKGFQYKPVSGEDLTAAVEAAFNTAEAKGKEPEGPVTESGSTTEPASGPEVSLQTSGTVFTPPCIQQPCRQQSGQHCAVR